MDMTPSSLLPPIAGVPVLSHLQAIHGLLLHNGMFEPDIDDLARLIGETSLCSKLTPFAGSMRQKDLPT